MVTAAGVGTALKVAAPIVGSMLGSFGHSSGGGIDVAGSKQLMNYGLDLNKEMTQWLNRNQYSFMREGLESAGYNPLLALGSSPSVGNVGTIAGQGSTASSQVNLGSVASALNTVANTKLQEQQALTEASKRANLSADTGLKLMETLYQKGLVKWQDVQNYADLAVKKTSAALNTASASASTTNSRANMINATEGNLQRYGIQKVEQFINWFKNPHTPINKMPRSNIPDYVRRAGF